MAQRHFLAASKRADLSSEVKGFCEVATKPVETLGDWAIGEKDFARFRA